MKRLKKLSIVIPAKNEAKRINRTLSLYGKYFASKNSNLDVEIIVVVNSSFDATSRCVEDYSKKYPFIKRIDTSYEVGKGGAVALGFSKANGDYIGFVDADGAVPPSEVYRLFEFISETPQFDGVIGKRDVSMSYISFKRRLLSKLFNLSARFVFGIDYKDTQCSIKIFKKKHAKTIARKLTNTGWAFDINLLLISKYLNYKIIELEVIWNEKAGSKFSLFDALVKTPIELLSLKILEIGYTLQIVTTRVINHKQDKNVASQKKNVLIYAWRDIKHPDAGGSEIYLHEVAKRLAKKHKITLFTSRPGNLSDRDKIDSINVIRKGNFKTVRIWAFIYYLLYFRHDMDFLIDTENGIPFFTPLYSRKPKLMILYHIHGVMWFKQYRPPISIIGFLIEYLIMPVVYFRTPLVTISPSSLSELKGMGLSEKRLFSGYSAVQAKLFSNTAKSDKPLLLYLGRIKSYKRVELLLKAVKLLSVQTPNVKAIVAGTGDYLDELKKIAIKLGVDDRVTFMGLVSEKKKWELMQQAWVFVMPSIKEGWGITVLEAAKCGTPTVAFNVGGLKDSVKHNLTGLLVENMNEFVFSINLLIKNEKLRQTMATNCKRWVGQFSWNATARIFENIISSFESSSSFMSDKIYPWDLDLGVDAITTLADIK